MCIRSLYKFWEDHYVQIGLGLYTTTFPSPGRDTFEEPLRQLLKNANKQLRETKNHLFSNGGFGFVVLALNRFRSLAPVKVFDLTCSILEEGFSAIDGFMICTPSWDTLYSDPKTQLHPPDCILAIPDRTPELMFRVLQGIASLWCDRYNEGRNVGIRPRSYFYHSKE